MRAIEISKPGGPEVLSAVERPKPSPSSGEVLIAVKAAGVNRPDIVQRQGFYPPPPGASDIPGLEVAGIVESVGHGVKNIAIGQRVCALLTGGGYAEYGLAYAECVLPIPSGLDFIEAAALPETYFTVWSNLFDRAGLENSDTLLVHGGSSGIGSTAIQLAKAFGSDVIATAGSDDKTEFCKNLGADLVINYRTEDYVQIISEARSAGVNVVLDMVGGDYIDRNIQCMAPEGRHVSIAFLKGPNLTLNMLPVMLKRLTLTGSTLRARDKEFKGAIAQSLHEKVWPLLENKSCVPQIYKTFPLDQAEDAHALMETSEHQGKIILTV
ncbi:NAD(P)H-quinone oxidoreductase [Temperatibacter marinus]|uniref:NAD(P)H-quinone oxidoreductase n=1 Tax=Temperatibacter marinus TaxID=1456591 RepID=A0AA52HAM5_9PROT|nr:NAD(P)H-quinone oxidoreductase [Temperatibacter marinus]WND02900.1 NAD(P)H-quinone oxidoreductase [Temperatibacter marinus]